VKRLKGGTAVLLRAKDDNREFEPTASLCACAFDVREPPDHGAVSTG